MEKKFKNEQINFMKLQVANTSGVLLISVKYNEKSKNQNLDHIKSYTPETRLSLIEKSLYCLKTEYVKILEVLEAECAKLQKARPDSLLEDIAGTGAIPGGEINSLAAKSQNSALLYQSINENHSYLQIFSRFQELLQVFGDVFDQKIRDFVSSLMEFLNKTTCIEDILDSEVAKSYFAECLQPGERYILTNQIYIPFAKELLKHLQFSPFKISSSMKSLSILKKIQFNFEVLLVCSSVLIENTCIMQQVVPDCMKLENLNETKNNSFVIPRIKNDPNPLTIQIGFIKSRQASPEQLESSDYRFFKIRRALRCIPTAVFCSDKEISTLSEICSKKSENLENGISQEFIEVNLRQQKHNEGSLEEIVEELSEYLNYYENNKKKNRYHNRKHGGNNNRHFKNNKGESGSRGGNNNGSNYYNNSRQGDMSRKNWGGKSYKDRKKHHVHSNNMKQQRADNRFYSDNTNTMFKNYALMYPNQVQLSNADQSDSNTLTGTNGMLSPTYKMQKTEINNFDSPKKNKADITTKKSLKASSTSYHFQGLNKHNKVDHLSETTSNDKFSLHFEINTNKSERKESLNTVNIDRMISSNKKKQTKLQKFVKDASPCGSLYENPTDSRSSLMGFMVSNQGINSPRSTGTPDSIEIKKVITTQTSVQCDEKDLGKKIPNLQLEKIYSMDYRPKTNGVVKANFTSFEKEDKSQQADMKQEEKAVEQGAKEEGESEISEGDLPLGQANLSNNFQNNQNSAQFMNFMGQKTNTGTGQQQQFNYNSFPMNQQFNQNFFYQQQGQNFSQMCMNNGFGNNFPMFSQPYQQKMNFQNNQYSQNFGMGNQNHMRGKKFNNKFRNKKRQNGYKNWNNNNNDWNNHGDWSNTRNNRRKNMRRMSQKNSYNDKEDLFEEKNRAEDLDNVNSHYSQKYKNTGKNKDKKNKRRNRKMFSIGNFDNDGRSPRKNHRKEKKTASTIEIRDVEISEESFPKLSDTLDPAVGAVNTKGDAIGTSIASKSYSSKSKKFGRKNMKGSNNNSNRGQHKQSKENLKKSKKRNKKKNNFNKVNKQNEVIAE